MLPRAICVLAYETGLPAGEIGASVKRHPVVTFTRSSSAYLVALGEETDTDHVFTLDKKGVSTYRLHGKKLFRLAP
jgi:hypothetical protein